MLIFDASRPCHELLSEGLAFVQPAADTLVAFAASQSAIADPPDGGVNVFTAGLINAIQEPGSKPVTVLARAQAEVAHATGGRQSPFYIPVVVTSFTLPRRLRRSRRLRRRLCRPDPNRERAGRTQASA